jgi:serine phosphatase RsbU (regulator of sigma subunit)
MDPSRGFRPFLERLRPRWAWVCLALGVLWLLAPLSCRKGAGCLAALLALCLWAGGATLVFLGTRWLLRRLLFRVSRRLWVILLLVSLLPVLLLAVGFLSLGWLGLGAQVSRSVQGSLRIQEEALREASRQTSDKVALQALSTLGEASLRREPRLPKGVPPDYLGLVLEDGQLGLRLASPAGGGWRLLTLPLDHLAESGRNLWGGRAHLRLDASKDRSEMPAGPRLHLDLGEVRGRPPIRAWSEGDVATGKGLLRPFTLPPVTLRVVDWASGRPLSLSLTPETSLKELFMGYGFGEGNLSAKAFMAIVGLSALFLVLAGIQSVALIMGLLLARNLGKAMDCLTKGVLRLSAGDFSARVKPRGRDQVTRLAVAFNEMAQRLQQASEERAERLRLEEELRVAREVQMRLLPDVGALTSAIQATVIPAREVAGDYFDVFKLPDGRLAFLIADVSGKGTSAAFYAAETKGVLAALDKAALDPREVVTRLNAIWRASHPRSLFLTLVYGSYDPATGAFALVRAGHPAPILARGRGGVERLCPRGLGIGLADQAFQANLELATGVLEPGDSLVCFTDGLSEARNPQGELFGEARLAELLAQPGPDPKPLVLSAVSQFTAGGHLDDDLTLLILQR